MALRYIGRETGCAVPAEAGDEYFEEIRTKEGKLVSHVPGKLEVTNAAKGEGRLIFDGLGADANARKVNIWIIWSAILVETETGPLTSTA